MAVSRKILDTLYMSTKNSDLVKERNVTPMW